MVDILLPANCNPFIDSQVCRLALVGFACPGVDKHQCCTIYTPDGIRVRESRNLCVFKNLRNPAFSKGHTKKKVNPLKQSKRKSVGA